jgi:hypothetical protein
MSLGLGNGGHEEEAMRFTFVIRRNGDVVSAARQAAPIIRVRRAKTCTTDGPFAETKEQLGGAAFPSR